MMEHFVQGVLTVEDEVYIGEPDLRLADGQRIRILYSDLRSDEEQTGEEDNPLSVLLEANKWFELLLIVQLGLGKTKKVTYAPSVPPGIEFKLVTKEIKAYSQVIHRNDVVQGIILDLNWNAASQSYLAVAGQRVYTHHYVLIGTAIGRMFVSNEALRARLGERIEQLAPGGYLEWEPARYDLLAILAKRDPLPGE